MFASAASSKGSIPLVRRSSTGSHGLSAFLTMLSARPLGMHGGIAVVTGVVDGARSACLGIGAVVHPGVVCPVSSAVSSVSTEGSLAGRATAPTTPTPVPTTSLLFRSFSA